MPKLPVVQRETIADGHHPLTLHRHSICWASIIGGAVAAISVSIIMLILGSGLGFASISPWADRGASVATFTALSATWLIVTQWASSGIGGYITGRLRGRGSDLHDDEVYFRDTAHGFLAWAVATVITVMVLASAVSTITGGVAKAGTAVVAAGAAGAGHEAAKNADNDSNGYYVDTLFRSDNSTASSEDARTETGRILAKGAMDGTISDADKSRLSQVVAKQTGISEQEASTRVNNTLADIDHAKVKAKEAADKAKKTATYVAIFTALSMFLGAFISAITAVIGGKLRDEHDYRTV